MPGEAPRFAIPSAVNALDNDTYANDSGYPQHAALGRQLARNDRALHANLRRTLVGWSAPHQAVHRIGLLSGVHFGPWDAWGSPGVRRAEWFLRLRIETSGRLRFIPYSLPVWPYVGPSADDPYQVNLDDPGAGAELTYGRTGDVNVTLAMPLRPGPQRIGFVLLSDMTTGSPTAPATVNNWNRDLVTGAAGAFAGLSTPYTRRVLRLLDGSNNPNSDWHDIIDVQTLVNANNSAVVWPPITRERGVVAGADQFEVRAIYYADVYSITCREVPLTEMP